MPLKTNLWNSVLWYVITPYHSTHYSCTSEIINRQYRALLVGVSNECEPATNSCSSDVEDESQYVLVPTYTFIPFRFTSLLISNQIAIDDLAKL
jgi:hypothetical protein